MSNHIAFIGVGNMGNPMAQQLVKAGQNVKVFDVSPDVIEIAKQSGLNVTSSMEELLQGATTVISMLPEGKHVRSLYLGDNGILKKILQQKFYMEEINQKAESTKMVFIMSQHYFLDYL